MGEDRKYTFNKTERLYSKVIIERLFAGRNHSFPAFPLRVVYMQQEFDEDTQISILISVSKKRFKRAVKRNRIKRQIREAYRRNKYILLDALRDKKNMKVYVAFIWIDNQMHSTNEIEQKMKKLLIHIAENI